MDATSRAELNQLLAMISAAVGDPTAPMDIEAMRAMQDRMGLATPVPDGVTISRLLIGDLPAERCAPRGADWTRAILHLHGGGYVFGSPRGHRGFIAALADRAGCIALSPDYRLAPENPHPAAVEDALAAYRHLLDRGVAPGRIAVTGDSAGGGLAMAMALSLKAAGLPQPGGYALISPWVDLTQSGESYDTKAAADPMVSRRGLTDMASAYLAGGDARAATASPLFADLSGLPQVYIQVGSEEVLLSDSTRLAAALGTAKVAVMLEIWPDMPHVFPIFQHMLTPGREATGRLSGFVRAVQGAD